MSIIGYGPKTKTKNEQKEKKYLFILSTQLKEKIVELPKKDMDRGTKAPIFIQSFSDSLLILFNISLTLQRQLENA